MMSHRITRHFTHLAIKKPFRERFEEGDVNFFYVDDDKIDDLHLFNFILLCVYVCGDFNIFIAYYITLVLHECL
jgi:hypothetical protein